MTIRSDSINSEIITEVTKWKARVEMLHLTSEELRSSDVTYSFDR